MYEYEKQRLVRISSYAGARPDYVQGGGGNTSVKFDDTLMAIKASGYMLKDITPDRGYITLDYRKVRDYYGSVDPGADGDHEAESLRVSLESIRLLEGMENKRPSVEAGFHSFLGKCVIHTHSVYANILCCSAEGEDIAGKILSGMRYVFVPYLDPGFRLALTIKKITDEYTSENGAPPDLIFLKNHGLIVHSDKDERAIELHEKANDLIREHFGIKDYPVPAVRKVEGGFSSATDYIGDFIDSHGADEAYFGNVRLFPDQLVYIGSKLGKEIRIKDGAGIRYAVGEKEAGAIEETLLGVTFVINSIEKAGLTLTQMDERAADFISNWEGEKYRSEVIRK